MIIARLITGILFVPITLIICGLGSPLHLLIFVILISFVAIIELNDILKKRNIEISSLVTTLGVITIPVILYFFPSLSLYILVFYLFLTLAIYLIKREIKGFITAGSVSVFAIFYIGWMLGHLILIRNLQMGNYLLVAIFIIVWSVDVSAYTIGSLIGRHKILPTISPKKSYEGTIAGIVFGTLTTVGIFYLFFHKYEPDLVHLLILGLITSISATFGDFLESAIKRDAGVKDSGDFLPGHGGVLDRFDSMIIAAPVFYYILKILTGF
jgi:phosphatidate cytidylyltransferase